jgi:hypothetical protein
MAVDDKADGPSRNAVAVLNETDRALLEQMRERIAERSQIRRTPADGGVADRRETKRARLERNQEQLEELFDEAVARPAVARALKESGYDAADLRQAGLRDTWARDVAPAISATQTTASRELDQQRRDAVAQAARAMIDLRLDNRTPSTDRWFDDLERSARASLGGERASEKQVAQRLVEWAEEAMSAVSDPVATTARTILIQHAFAAELTGEWQGQRRREPALRVALEHAGMSPGATPRGEELANADAPLAAKSRPATQRVEADGPEEPNRVFAPDDGESLPARRQIADLTEAARKAANTQPATDPGLFGRLRGYWGAKAQAAPPDRTSQADDGEPLPDVLKRRYAVHVSRDGRMIELFEAGAKAPAITLDAKSISTKHNEGAVIADIILLARDRGWQTLKLSGTAEFKDAVWLEASKAGLVAQHEPSSAMRAAFVKWDQERPANEIQQAARTRGQEQAPRRDEGLAQAFAAKSAEERLADPRLRNAQLELMIGIRTAEKELKRPIAQMPEVAQALAAAIREQLAQGRMFDAPFVIPEAPTRGAKQAATPRIEADRISPPRP